MLKLATSSRLQLGVLGRRPFHLSLTAQCSKRPEPHKLSDRILAREPFDPPKISEQPSPSNAQKMSEPAQEQPPEEPKKGLKAAFARYGPTFVVTYCSIWALGIPAFYLTYSAIGIQGTDVFNALQSIGLEKIMDLSTKQQYITDFGVWGGAFITNELFEPARLLIAIFFVRWWKGRAKSTENNVKK